MLLQFGQFTVEFFVLSQSVVFSFYFVQFFLHLARNETATIFTKISFFHTVSSLFNKKNRCLCFVCQNISTGTFFYWKLSSLYTFCDTQKYSQNIPAFVNTKLSAPPKESAVHFYLLFQVEWIVLNFVPNVNRCWKFFFAIFVLF